MPSKYERNGKRSVGYKSTTKPELRATIAECLEFFKNEIFLGSHYPDSFQQRLEAMRSKCYLALGRPSLLELDLIKRMAKG